MRTGDPVSSIYLGRVQMDRLMKWGIANCHQTSTQREVSESARRLEVMGIPVYGVDDEDHCACTAA